MNSDETIEEWWSRQLTDGFLTTLVNVARVYGHSGDWIEISDFVREMFGIAGKECPKLEPVEHRS